MFPTAPDRDSGWRVFFPNLVLVPILLAATIACQKERSDAPAPAAPAVPAPPAPAVPLPTAPSSEPPTAPPPEPAAIAPPAPVASPLRTALLAVKDLDGFRALIADGFRLLEGRGKRPPRIAALSGARLDAKAFEQKIKPLLPREPDPAGGEGEDFQCDDVARSCVFKDENGRATTYLFEPAAPDSPAATKLREIRTDPAKAN
jgi:hypothetical protein